MTRALLAAACIAIAGAGTAGAQPYDPGFRWRTLDTPRFRIHYHQGEEVIAQEVAREAERAHALLAPRLGYAPSRTEIVLSDDTDDANGMATPVPYDTIRLFAVPPDSQSELQNYRSWVRQLVQHEYAHILHLDNITGFPRLVNRVFGKILPPNALLPPLLVEGLAVLNEAEGDAAAGRNGSAQFDMEARALALDGRFPRLDEASNPPLRWPLGDVPYLLGGRFMGFLQTRYGAEAIAGFATSQGRELWPYAPSSAGRRWFGGKDFPTLWAEYADAERAYAEGRRAWVHTRPVTEPAPLTRRGGMIRYPRFSPDGSFIAYFERSLDEKPAIRRVSADGRDLGQVAVVDANGSLAIASRREAVVAIGEVFREHRIYDDLYRVDLRSGRRRRLTRGERATDPDVAPDGTLVYVRRTGGGTMALVRRRPGGDEEVLFAHGGAQVFMPRIARDGRVAFELHEGGRRDIAVWEEGRVVRVTDDDALDTTPAWTPDGRFLLFASDRGGIFNLHAWDSRSGAIRQVTNIELGAFQPDVSPDGKTIAFVSYSRAGYDLATIPFDESSWLNPFAPPPVPDDAPATAAETALPDPVPSRPYSPWPTLRPTFWLPIVASDGAGRIYGALTGGIDVLAHHAYLVQGWWSASGHEPGYAAAYQGTWSWPRLDVSSSLVLDDSPGFPDRLQRVWEYANTGATFTFTRLARSVAIRIGWNGTSYDSIEPQLPIPAALEPFRFRDGFLSEGSILLRYSDARRFVRSISPEEGRTATLQLRLAAPEIGSDFSLARARASLDQYLRVPLTKHWVLALRASGGVADGTIGHRVPFKLGGVSVPDVLALLPGNVSTPSDQLRGYPSGALGGTGYVLGNVELRFPLAEPTRGRSTWPIFLRRAHGAVFLDGGDAFDLPGETPLAGHHLAADELRFGTGAELRLEVVLGYYLRTDVRIGAARPLGALLGRGRAADREIGLEPDPVVFYVTIGSSF